MVPDGVNCTLLSPVNVISSSAVNVGVVGGSIASSEGEVLGLELSIRQVCELIELHSVCSLISPVKLVVPLNKLEVLLVDLETVVID